MSRTPRDAACLTSYAQQRIADILHQIMRPGGPPGCTSAKLAVAGVAALAAKQILGNGSLSVFRL